MQIESFFPLNDNSSMDGRTIFAVFLIEFGYNLWLDCLEVHTTCCLSLDTHGYIM